MQRRLLDCVIKLHNRRSKMKEIKNVERFPYTYKVYDRFSRQYVGPFSSINEAVEKVAKHHRFWRHEFSENRDAIRYTILNEVVRYHHPDDAYGHLVIIRIEDDSIVPLAIINKECKKPYRERIEDYDRAKDIRIKKSSATKIKDSYHSSKGIYTDRYHPCDIIGYHHYPKAVLNEKRHNCVTDDYEAECEIRIHGRRRFTDSLWSYERQKAAFTTYKSWKHHSKRRKQWLPR